VSTINGTLMGMLLDELVADEKNLADIGERVNAKLVWRGHTYSLSKQGVHEYNMIHAKVIDAPRIHEGEVMPFAEALDRLIKGGGRS
jgi:hypothetical protein